MSVEEAGDDRQALPVEAADTVAGQTDPYRSVLAIFIGPNSEKFLKVYDKTDGDLSRIAAGWSWPAFLVPTVWLLYRKLYIEAAVYFLVVGALHIFAANLAVFVALLLFLPIGVFGKCYYLQRADWKIKKILDAGGSIDEVEAGIAKAGGVSRIGAWIGIAIFVLGMIAILWAALAGLGIGS